MAENEDAFAIEAQSQTTLPPNQRLQRRARKEGQAREEPERDSDSEENETSPFLPRKSASAQAAPFGDLPPDGADFLTKPWTAYQGLQWYKTPSIFWLLPAFFPFCLAFGGLLVPKTYLVLNLICKDYLLKRASADPGFHALPVVPGDQNEQCRDAHIQALVARFQLYASLLSGIFSAIVTPYLGSLSDRIGRRKTIAYSTLGLLAESVITLVIASNPEKLSVYWLLVGYLLDGMCGSFTAAMSVSMAYAADCTPPQRRNVAIGYFYGVLFTGIAIGPLVASLLMKWTGSLLIVFYFAVGCHVLFICFVLFVIPESVSKTRQRLAREKHRAQKQVKKDESWWVMMKNYNLFEPLWILHPKGPGTSTALRRNLSLLASIDTIIFGVAMGSMGIILIYPQYVFGWDPVQASQFLSVSNISRVFGLFIALPTVTRIFRNDSSGHQGADMLDIRIIRFAILLEGIGYVGYATAMTDGMMVAAGVIASFGGIASPTLASAITAHVPADRTGQVLGALGLLHALARVVSPTVCNTVYSLTVGKFTPTVFVGLASMFVIVFILSWFLKPGISFEESDDTAIPQSNDDEPSVPTSE